MVQTMNSFFCRMASDWNDFDGKAISISAVGYYLPENYFLKTT